MKVTIKSAEEIEKMRRAGEILAAVHQNLAREIKPGMSTLDIDRLGEEMIRGYGCIPSFKNYCGYPASICVSVNEEVVHGIPTDERIIKEGDIVSLDAGVIYEGYHSDAARTVAVGEVSEEAKMYTCSWCGKPTPNYREYSHPMAGILGESGYSICDECLRRSVSRGNGRTSSALRNA